MSSQKALRELEENAGTQFDPEVVGVFKTVIQKESIN